MLTRERYQALLVEHGFTHAIMTSQQLGLAKAIFDEGAVFGMMKSDQQILKLVQEGKELETDRFRLMRIEAAALNLVSQRGCPSGTEYAYTKLEEALS